MSNKTSIIAISGKQYSGKDTLAKILIEKMPDFKRVGIGDAIKIEYGKKHNLTFEEIEKNKHKYRDDLIELGNYGRGISPDYWLEKISNMDKVIIPDIRVEYEAEFFRKRGAFLIRVNSAYKKRSERGIIVSDGDNTEIALDDYNLWNVIVDNNSDYNSLFRHADKVVMLFKNFIGLS